MYNIFIVLQALFMSRFCPEIWGKRSSGEKEQQLTAHGAQG
jgi:hypothetical protein